MAPSVAWRNEHLPPILLHLLAETSMHGLAWGRVHSSYHPLVAWFGTARREGFSFLERRRVSCDLGGRYVNVVTEYHCSYPSTAFLISGTFICRTFSRRLSLGPFKSLRSG